MRIPKLLLAVCVATVCTSFLSVRAQDTDNAAQAAARAALEQKMRELDAQSSQTNAAPAAPQNETPPAQPPPVVSAEQTPAPFAATVPTPPTVSDSEAQDKARAELEQKMRELDAQSSQTNVTPAASQNETPPAQPAPGVSTAQTPPAQPAPILINSSGVVAPETASQPAAAMTSVATPAPVEAQVPPAAGSSLFEPASPTASNTAEQSAANAALQQKMAELSQGQSAQFQPVPAAPSEPSDAMFPVKTSEFEPMQAPPLPISPDKEARLQALTAKYMANEISPEDYFKQREEILGGP